MTVVTVIVEDVINLFIYDIRYGKKRTEND